MSSSPSPASQSEPDPRAQGASRAGRNLPVAIVTALVLAGLLFLTLFTSRPAFFVLVAAVVLLSQFELYRTLRQRGFRVALSLGIAAGAILLVGAYRSGPRALSFALTMTVLASFAWFLVDRNRRGATEGVAATVLGVVYVPFLGAHVVLMRGLPDGAAITISYIGLVAFYDIGAYASGVLFGRHPMAPGISPKKSWEGAAGATILIALIAVFAGPHIGPFRVGTALGLAGLTAVVAPLGDLAESMLKRDLDVKDMGTLLPGHGGVLDRIDALLLVAPLAYWFVRTAVV